MGDNERVELIIMECYHIESETMEANGSKVDVVLREGD